MRHSDSIKELAAALAKAAPNIKHAVKSSENPFFKSKYADLAAVTDACRGALAEQGVTFAHSVDSADGLTVTVACLIMHSSGEWIESSLTVKPLKADPQGIGSAATYARRYTLAALAGVATEDDDGNAASEPQKSAASPQRKTPERPATPADNGSAITKQSVAKLARTWSKVQKEDVAAVISELCARLQLDKAKLDSTGLKLLDETIRGNLELGVTHEEWAKGKVTT